MYTITFFPLRVLGAFFYFLRDNCRVQIRGFGTLCRLYPFNHLFITKGVYFWFSTKISGNYSRVIGWGNNEVLILRYLTSLSRFQKKMRPDEKLHLIDIGGYFGEIALFCAKSGGFDHITCFEPIPESYNAIQKAINANGFKNVEVKEIAISDTNGEEEFEFDRLNPSGSGFGNGRGSSLTLSVKKMTLDSFCGPNENGIRYYIKIDAEGHEEKIIDGSLNLIISSVDVIIMEYNQVTKSTCSLSRIFNKLRGEFAMVPLPNFGDDFSVSDVVFIRKELYNKIIEAM